MELPGVKHMMMKLQRMHDEQIKKIAQSLKAPYSVRKTDSIISETSREVSKQITRPENAENNPISQKKSRAHKSRVMGPTGNPEKQMLPERSLKTVPDIQCIRCGDRFPVTDFLYTKKTCLCISCWETEVN